jgi:hypothetical protein
MTLPSLQKIVHDLRRTFSRFPLALACSLLGTAAALILIEREDPDRASVLYNALFAFSLGFPLLVTIPFVAKKWSWSNLQLFGVQAISVLALVIYATSIPSDISHAPLVHLYRHLLLTLGLILLVSFANHIGPGQQNGFWQFNKTLFSRLFTAALFAIVLFLGLSIALAAMDRLFGMDVPGKRYGELWIAILGLFAPLFFLSGMPEDLDDLDISDEYPKGLRVFAQYILAPLVIVYLVILYAYIVKIIAQWSWPQGWVSRLVLSFSATGIFSLALLYPIREQIENRWVKSAIRWFWIAIIPMIVVLLLAIWQRISDYGITESRYIGVVLAAWLAVMALYFNLSKTKGLKIIPASLCLLALAISFGPWGVFRVSEQSQIRRLEEMLIADSILVNGMVQKAPGDVSARNITEISSILSYLHEVHGYEGIQPWFAESLQLDSGGTRNYKDASTVAKMLGIRFDMYGKGGPDGSYSVTVDLRSPVMTSGYDHLVRASLGRSDADTTASNDDTLCQVLTTPDSIVLRIVRDTVATDSLVMDLRPLIDNVTAAYGSLRGQEIPAEEATAEYVFAGMRAKIIILSMTVQRTEDTTKLTHYDALILYSHDAQASDR